MTIYLIQEKDLEKKIGKTKEQIIEELTVIDFANKKSKFIKNKIKENKYYVLFSADQNKSSGYLAYQVKDKYIEIGMIRISPDADYFYVLKDLIDDLLKKNSFQKLGWIRLWVPQDFEHINLCKCLVKYGFKCYPDKNDFTRFFYKKSYLKENDNEG